MRLVLYVVASYISHTRATYRLEVETERIGRKVGNIYVGLTAEAQAIHWNSSERGGTRPILGGNAFHADLSYIRTSLFFRFRYGRNLCESHDPGQTQCMISSFRTLSSPLSLCSP